MLHRHFRRYWCADGGASPYDGFFDHAKALGAHSFRDLSLQFIAALLNPSPDTPIGNFPQDASLPADYPPNHPVR